jgi:hypothetical protein
MLTDDALDGLRQQLFTAVLRLDREGDAGDKEVWIEWIDDPDSASTASLLNYVRDSRFELDILRALAGIGAAVADDLLARLPIPISMISDSRWQRRRELATWIERLSAFQLQQLIWKAQSLADCSAHGRVAITVGELSEAELIEIMDVEIPPHLRWTLDDLDRRQAVLRLLIFALEAAGVTGHEQADFAIGQGLPATWFVDVAESRCRDISLDQLAALYDVAAGRVGWRPFREIVARYVDEARGGREHGY